MFLTIDRRGRAFMATSAFLAAALTNVGAVPLGLLGILACLWAISGDPLPSGDDLARPGAAMMAVLGLAGLQAGLIDLPIEDSVSRTVWLIMLFLLIGGCATRLLNRPTWLGNAALVIAVIGSIVIGSRTIAASGVGGQSDVWLLQKSAAEAVQNGRNPYRFATSPRADPNLPSGSVIIQGYPYPPLAMVAPVAASALTGEPRWAMLAIWVFFVGCLGSAALKAGGRLLPLVLLFAVWPLFRVTLFSSWTEPISMAIVACLPLAASKAEPRGRVYTTALLAFVAVSKQYFALLVPAALASRYRDKRPLAIAVAFAGVLTLLPYLLLGPADLFHALYTEPAAIDVARSDSYSLTGLLASLGLQVVPLPRFAWLSLIVIFGLVIGRMVRSGPELVLASACVLAFAFWTSVAFVNYWLVCAALAATGAIWEERELHLRVAKPS